MYVYINRKNIYRIVRAYGVKEITIAAFYYSDDGNFGYGRRKTNEKTEREFLKIIEKEKEGLNGGFAMIDYSASKGLECALDAGVPNLFVDIFFDSTSSS